LLFSEFCNGPIRLATFTTGLRVFLNLRKKGSFSRVCRKKSQDFALGSPSKEHYGVMLTADFMQQLICKRREDGQASFAPVGVESQSMVDTSQQLCQIISLMGEQTPTKKAKVKWRHGRENLGEGGPQPANQRERVDVPWLGYQFAGHG
jgi:hypothetical protein